MTDVTSSRMQENTVSIVNELVPRIIDDERDLIDNLCKVSPCLATIHNRLGEREREREKES